MSRHARRPVGSVLRVEAWVWEDKCEVDFESLEEEGRVIGWEGPALLQKSYFTR